MLTSAQYSPQALRYVIDNIKRLPMEDIDKTDVSNTAISEDDELMLKEVIQEDADLYYLHHYLSEVLRPGDDF